MVLKLLREHKLFAKRTKCEYFKPELKYLGYLVCTSGVRPDPAKVETKANLPKLSSVHEIRQFLGLANYFRKFIRGYAAVSYPLTDLLKGLSKQERAGVRNRSKQRSPDAAEALRVPFAGRWSAACSASFSAVQTALVSAPVLALPDPGKHYTLVSYACSKPWSVLS